jgi:hypothetical protein
MDRLGGAMNAGWDVFRDLLEEEARLLGSLNAASREYTLFLDGRYRSIWLVDLHRQNTSGLGFLNQAFDRYHNPFRYFAANFRYAASNFRFSR